MDKYRQAAEKKLTNKVHPDTIAREALVNAEFSARERENLFNNAYGDILTDYFIEWLQTEPHETKSREFLYSAAMSLGQVKSKLIQYETYGRNVPHIDSTHQDDDKETI